MPAYKPRLARFLKTRATMIERVGSTPPSHPVRIPGALAQALGRVQASVAVQDGPPTREWQAIHNRSEVARLSNVGTPVAQIAAALGLSYRHVVALRAQLGVGRRR